MLNLNQPLKHIATNDNLPLTAFSQRLQMRGIQTDLFRQIGKKLSIYNLSYAHFLMFNKPVLYLHLTVLLSLIVQSVSL